MKLTHLRVRRMPGIDDPFVLEDLGPGLNLIVGGNGSGKTSLCRAVRATLWPGADTIPEAWVEATWRTAVATLRSVRDGGGVGWQRDGLDCERPDLPDDRLARCFTLGVLDLLTGDETDEGIAREIRRQMAGGYDLDAVLTETFGLKSRHGRDDKKLLATRQRGLVSLQSVQARLAERETELELLEAELVAARTAREAIDGLRIADELARGRDRLAQLDTELRTMPAVLARMRGDELERLADGRREGTELAEQQRLIARELAATEIRIGACGLRGGPVDESAIGQRLAEARRLADLESQLRDSDNQQARARGKLEAAGAELDPTGAGRRRSIEIPPDASEAEFAPTGVLRAGPLAGTALEPAAGLLQRATELSQRRAALEARLAVVGGATDVSEELPRLGGRALRDWLAAAARIDKTGQVRLVWVGAIALAVGAFLARAVSASWIGLAGLGAGGLIATWLLERACRLEQAAAARRFADSELPGPEPPATWTRAAVADHLRDLDEAVALAIRAREDAAEAKRLEAELLEIGRHERELDGRRQRLRASLGVDLGLSDLTAAVLAERVRAYDAAEQELAAVSDLSEKLAADIAARADSLGRFLASHGQAVPAGEARADDFQERLIELKDRGLRLQTSTADRDRLRRDRAGLAERQAAVDARVTRLLGDLGLEPTAPDGAVDDLVRALDGYRATVEERNLVGRKVADASDRLARWPELRALTRDEVADRLKAEARVADRFEQLVSEIRSIQDDIERARAGNVVELALADLEAARSALSDRREEALQRQAGQFLIERVSAEYADRTRPELLKRAMHWFAAFTHHSYELRVEARADGAVFRAFDTATDRGLSLSQLSDGTRMQLLLAVRLAFATRTERSERLPIFLDEVLATSDPGRFRAVAESIALLVQEDDRQVFYLTSNPADMEHWRHILEARAMAPVAPIDLASVRGRGVTVTDAATLRKPPTPRIPAPTPQMAPEDYAIALAVSRFDPDRPVGAVHLYYLLSEREDLELLYRLVSASIDTVGKWRAWRREGGATAVFVNEAEAARLETGTRLLEAFLEAFRIGRGRRLTRTAIEASGVVTDRFLRDLAELLAELGGDTERLLAAIASKADVRVRGFRTDKLEALRDYCIEHGYLDERAVLDTADIEALVASALAELRLPFRLDPAQIARRVRELSALCEGG